MDTPPLRAGEIALFLPFASSARLSRSTQSSHSTLHEQHTPPRTPAHRPRMTCMAPTPQKTKRRTGGEIDDAHTEHEDPPFTPQLASAQGRAELHNLHHDQAKESASTRTGSISTSIRLSRERLTRHRATEMSVPRGSTPRRGVNEPKLRVQRSCASTLITTVARRARRDAHASRAHGNKALNVQPRVQPHQRMPNHIRSYACSSHTPPHDLVCYTTTRDQPSSLLSPHASHPGLLLSPQQLLPLGPVLLPICLPVPARGGGPPSAGLCLLLHLSQVGLLISCQRFLPLRQDLRAVKNAGRKRHRKDGTSTSTSTSIQERRGKQNKRVVVVVV